MKENNKFQMPPVLTPEMVKALAENADTLRSVISSGDEKTALTQGCGTGKFNQCCCPQFLKFKFILCNVWIFNDNAECR